MRGLRRVINDVVRLASKAAAHHPGPGVSERERVATISAQQLSLHVHGHAACPRLCTFHRILVSLPPAATVLTLLRPDQTPTSTATALRPHGQRDASPAMVRVNPCSVYVTCSAHRAHRTFRMFRAHHMFRMFRQSTHISSPPIKFPFPQGFSHKLIFGTAIRLHFIIADFEAELLKGFTASNSPHFHHVTTGCRIAGNTRRVLEECCQLPLIMIE